MGFFAWVSVQLNRGFASIKKKKAKNKQEKGFFVLLVLKRVLCNAVWKQ